MPTIFVSTSAKPENEEETNTKFKKQMYGILKGFMSNNKLWPDQKDHIMVSVETGVMMSLGGVPDEYELEEEGEFQGKIK